MKFQEITLGDLVTVRGNDGRVYELLCTTGGSPWEDVYLWDGEAEMQFSVKPSDVISVRKATYGEPQSLQGLDHVPAFSEPP